MLITRLYDEMGTPCDYVFIEVNKAFEELTGMRGADIIGKPITKVLPEIVNSEFNWIDFYGEVAIKGEKKEFEQFLEPLDRWYKVNAYSPEKGYFITGSSPKSLVLIIRYYKTTIYSVSNTCPALYIVCGEDQMPFWVSTNYEIIV